MSLKNSAVITEMEAAVSLSGVLSRLPASVSVATYPTSRPSEMVNGSSSIAALLGSLGDAAETAVFGTAVCAIAMVVTKANRQQGARPRAARMGRMFITEGKVGERKDSVRW